MRLADLICFRPAEIDLGCTLCMQFCPILHSVTDFAAAKQACFWFTQHTAHLLHLPGLSLGGLCHGKGIIIVLDWVHTC